MDREVTIYDHPFLDSNGPSYLYGPCDHKYCHKNVKHQCPHNWCGKKYYEHEYRITATGPMGKGRKTVKND
jgi:hypothetical protein